MIFFMAAITQILPIHHKINYKLYRGLTTRIGAYWNDCSGLSKALGASLPIHLLVAGLQSC